MKKKNTLSQKLFGKDTDRFAKWINERANTYLFTRLADSLSKLNKNFHDPKAQQEYIDAKTQWKLQIEKNKKSIINRANAQKPRKKDKPSKDALLDYKFKFDAKHGNARGWKKSAQIEYSIDGKTLNRILE
jgi:hypothetical protein